MCLFSEPANTAPLGPNPTHTYTHGLYFKDVSGATDICKVKHVNMQDRGLHQSEESLLTPCPEGLSMASPLLSNLPVLQGARSQNRS